MFFNQTLQPILSERSHSRFTASICPPSRGNEVYKEAETSRADI